MDDKQIVELRNIKTLASTTSGLNKSNKPDICMVPAQWMLIARVDRGEDLGLVDWFIFSRTDDVEALINKVSSGKAFNVQWFYTHKEELHKNKNRLRFVERSKRAKTWLQTMFIASVKKCGVTV